MVYPKEKLEVDLGLLKKALATLDQALAEPLTPLIRDAVIQRFEYVFELSWKTFRAAGLFKGSASNNPRDAIKLAYKMKWISQEEQWIKSMEARNLTSHSYDENVAKDVYDAAQKFPSLIHPAILEIEALLK